MSKLRFKVGDSVEADDDDGTRWEIVATSEDGAHLLAHGRGTNRVTIHSAFDYALSTFPHSPKFEKGERVKCKTVGSDVWEILSHNIEPDGRCRYFVRSDFGNSHVIYEECITEKIGE